MALYEARDKIAQLETALTRVDFAKKHLNRTASDLKREIHSCVSRKLECLRGREVDLLDQVDEVLEKKEEVLHQQQIHLNQVLGILRTGLSLMKDDASFEKQLKETLLKLNRIDLSPGETPHIAFRADHVGLTESILKYGRIDSNGLSFAAFEDPNIPSACLPRNLEDYEDVDFHIFNKPVQAVPTGGATKSITVTIPKLSNRMEDWLQKRAPSAKPSVSTPVLPLSLSRQSSSLSFQPAVMKCEREQPKSGASTPSDACSLNNWLSLIKNHSDLEEEHDFEIIDNSNKNQAVNVEAVDNKPMLEADFFSHIKKDSKLWINSASNDTSNNSEDLMEVTEGNFFKHIPREAELWLSKASQQLYTLEETPESDIFKHVSNQPSTWLRSRAHAKQLMPQSSRKPDLFDAPLTPTCKVDYSKWLFKSLDKKMTQEVKEDPDKDAMDISVPKNQGKLPQKNCSSGCRSVNSFQLEEVCRANELCSSASECLSQPNCAVFYKNNLAGKHENEPGRLVKPQNLSIDLWLTPSKDKRHDGNTKSICDPDDSNWLMHASGNTGPDVLNQRSSKFNLPKEETNQWLRVSNVPVQEPLSKSGLISLSSGSLSEWLVTPSPDTDIKSCKEKEHEMEKECSEGWSLCSTPSTISSDQFTKDVEIAADYLQKWIL